MAALATTLFQACKKTDFAPSIVHSSVTERFFRVPANASPVIRQAIQRMKQQNDAQPFAEAFVNRHGYINWEHAGYTIKPQDATLVAASDTIIEAAIVPDEKEYVSDLFYIKMDGEMFYKLLSAEQYEEFPFMEFATSTITGGSAEVMAAKFFKYQKEIFNSEFYKLLDPALFAAYKEGTGSEDYYISFKVDPNYVPPLDPLPFPILIQILNGSQSQPIAVLHYYLTNEAEMPEGGSSPGWSLEVPVENGGEHEGNSPFNCLSHKGWEPLKMGADGMYRGECGTDLYSLQTLWENLQNPVLFQQSAPIVDNNTTISEVDITLIDTLRPIAKMPSRENVQESDYGSSGNIEGVLSNMPNFTNQQLHSDLNNLFYWCTFFGGFYNNDGNMKTVANQMLTQFYSGQGGVYESGILNLNVSKSVNMIDFVHRFGDFIHLKLSENNWDFNNLNNLVIDQKKRPIFNGGYNKFNGLQIKVNDIAELQADIADYSINPVTHEWTATFVFTITDYFGLDLHDVLSYQNSHTGFAAWYLLQHTRNMQPLTTKIKVAFQIHHQ